MKIKMPRFIRYVIIIFAVLLLIYFLLCYMRREPFEPEAHVRTVQKNIVYLGQGWGMAERQQISFTSFGSHLINYDWFIALENAESETLFRDNKHLEYLGFIADEANKFNPDGLPIGVTQDQDKQGHRWVGLTCAACHTGQLTMNGSIIRIDGGQSLLNYTLFETELLAALKATLEQPEKWQRFFSRLKKIQPKLQEGKVHQDVAARIHELDSRYTINATTVPYGYGRLDAFGQIFNAIAVDALHISANKRAPDAPTSFPVLWDASHLDVVQWNASAPNVEPGPLAQNATTALAVYGTIDMMGRGQTYPSSIQIKNLGYIQRKFYKLTAPSWPQDILGKLNSVQLAQGKKIYQQECSRCHSVVDAGNPTRELSAILVPESEVGTDSHMVNNFTEGTVKTGKLEGKHFMLWFGKKMAATSTRLDVVIHTTMGALARHPWDSLCAVIEEFAHNKTSDVNANIHYYKARPINGIWASAPYLHNGSVPTVYDLLLPAKQRPQQFYVGNRELDTVKVGNQTTQTAASTLFDTTLLGNSNQGHEYGTQLVESDRLALLEYIKSL